MQGKIYLTVDDIAARLGIHERTVKRWLNDGKLRGTRLGNKSGWRVAQEDLDQYLAMRDSRLPLIHKALEERGIAKDKTALLELARRLGWKVTTVPKWEAEVEATRYPGNTTWSRSFDHETEIEALQDAIAMAIIAWDPNAALDVKRLISES